MKAVKKESDVRSGFKMNIKHIPKKAVMTAFYFLAFILAGIIVTHHNPLADQGTELMKKVMACILIVFTCVIFGIFYDRLVVLPKELLQNKKLIWKLAKNDFKKRYAGSYLGMIWAFVQPIVTVVMYWIVFDRVFNTRSQLVAGGIEVPYVLYLTAGLVPWFYFSEALTNGTTALMEYNYLVKKVVFKISILPIIKVIAATFIHAFFVVVLLLISIAYGYYPSIYTLQIFYYSFCEFVLVLAISYTTCAIVVFFRDLQQIIGIVLQIGMWATPILWDISMLSDKMKPLFKLNPMVYIVNGYRSAVYEQEWFFEHFYSSTYFWIFTITLFCIGSLIFKRLKVHFADVM
ncbi:ABC transporter permease [Kineothrix sp. MB12-C1]|uniref:ABC transporter permease n=1 Tax=Kineothrix sp. MB12-C1 TaxID=3070215 RepID=UPI0027D2FC21|nr:ABC transporter permease [Kineothrix sp. MB12-C1]WMC91765.1 ABC transporter permease [Kineothrix sp. MB12-C1]